MWLIIFGIVTTLLVVLLVALLVLEGNQRYRELERRDREIKEYQEIIESTLRDIRENKGGVIESFKTYKRE